MRLTAAKQFFQSTSRWTLLLALLTVAVLWFLSRNHSFVPMWVEGMGVNLQGDLSLLGYDKQPFPCSLRIGTFSLPLSINSHEGPGWFYLYAPTLYLWFNRITTDPYLYRYTGILLFLANGWILYYLLRKYYKPSISFYSAAAFLTCPLFLLGSLTDFELEQAMLVFFLLTVLLFSHYIKGGGVTLLLASAMTLGMTLLTRTEVLVWPIIPFSIYLLLMRPPLVLDRWKQTKRKPIVALAALVLFCLGASPVIAYNLVCPESNIFSFTVNTVLRRSLESTPLWERLVIRIEQFWSLDLLNIWPMYELHVANYVMAALWVVSACIIAVRWVVKRHPSLQLVMVSTILVLSVLTTASAVRVEALLIVEVAALVVITSALAYVEELGLRKVAHVAFIVLIAGNVAVAGMDWRRWNELPSNSQTMLNQSDPVLLASYLSEHHAGDRILYTNVGIPEYMQYMTTGRLKGEDIINWVSIDGFVNAVKLTLLNKSKERVFVAVSKEHDGLGGALPRTKVLYGLLDQYKVPYQVTHLSNQRNNSLYDLIIVPEGITLIPDSAMAETLVVSDVVDLRVALQPDGNRLVIGSVLGVGFKPGDSVRINGNLIVTTAYGNQAWVSFSMPLERLENENSFTLDLFRAESMEHSRTFTVRLPQ